MEAKMDTVLSVSGLRKSYGGLEAVGGVDLSVRKGEIFGILGHNGAGKTTTVECVLGTRKPDAGTVNVLGLDPVKDRKRLFARVGVQFQETRYQDKLRVSEACEVASSLYPRTRDWRELLTGFGLAGKERASVADLSGGERESCRWPWRSFPTRSCSSWTS
jgi:ABC-2 type transport system ATP-binding protein